MTSISRAGAVVWLACLVLPCASAPSAAADSDVEAGRTATQDDSLDAAPTWELQAPETSRSPASGAALAYDDHQQEVVSFGGYYDSDYVNDTWVWDGTDWTQLNPMNRPPGRADAGMAYDSAHGEMVLFGGHGGGDYGDTWTFTDGDWVQRHPVHSPEERGSTMMAYDPTRKQVILYGGSCYCGPHFQDSWAWDGADWIRLNPAHSPSGRVGSGFAYDPTRDALVMFGGTKRDPIDQTWSWNGEDWRQVSVRRSPPATSGPGAATFGRHLVVVGGYTKSNTFGRTWILGKGSWRLQKSTPAPPDRLAFGLAWDSARKEAVLFGGDNFFSQEFFDDTWTLSRSQSQVSQESHQQ